MNAIPAGSYLGGLGRLSHDPGFDRIRIEPSHEGHGIREALLAERLAAAGLSTRGSASSVRLGDLCTDPAAQAARAGIGAGGDILGTAFQSAGDPGWAIAGGIVQGVAQAGVRIWNAVCQAQQQQAAQQGSGSSGGGIDPGLLLLQQRQQQEQWRMQQQQQQMLAQQQAMMQQQMLAHQQAQQQAQQQQQQRTMLLIGGGGLLALVALMLLLRR